MDAHEIHSHERPEDAAPRPTYTGAVAVTPIFTDEAADMRCSTVQFAAGSRTGWHRHDGAQILTIADGDGLLVSDDGTVVRARPGTVVHVPAGERHWHGASVAEGMTHVALTIGTSRYEDAVTDDEHSTADAQARTPA